MAQAPIVQVAGLKSLVRDMKKLGAPGGDLLKALQQAALHSGDPVAAMTRASLPQVSGRLANDVRVSATRTGASIRMGRATVRYAGWIEFGGTRRAPHESVRDYQALGRYMFPAARSLAPSVAASYQRGATAAIAQFRWSNTTVAPSSVHD
jgi:hypothetical protein